MTMLAKLVGAVSLALVLLAMILCLLLVGSSKRRGEGHWRCYFRILVSSLLNVLMVASVMVAVLYTVAGMTYWVFLVIEMKGI